MVPDNFIYFASAVHLGRSGNVAPREIGPEVRLTTRETLSLRSQTQRALAG